VLRLAAPFNATARELAPDLGVRKNIDTSKARTMLGWKPRPPQEAVLATAESMLKLGVV
jgi:nucleoside-diphosphate-sugar epimerase